MDTVGRPVERLAFQWPGASGVTAPQKVAISQNTGGGHGGANGGSRVEGLSG